MTEFGANPRVFARLEEARREYRRHQLGRVRMMVVSLAVMVATIGWTLGRGFSAPHPASLLAIAALLLLGAAGVTAGVCRAIAWVAE